ncbi:hypothetical protein V476_25530 [Pseudomonas syringae KCTC 12500]|uniref:hypothetical protein n=1 Tax=Pseudomonas syringae TaxID=317 RepID=UPI0003FFFA82|nr:hypothetical protein [Pseudomonas syringae]KMY04297.1 hypothetical protein V476_25530 [Pseudomonas syringae KCTC 12500]KPY67207.1 Uncharacterized protein ALO45_02427 [Pseudomonas syringae pv. syringae]POR87607.1 hypothetical protein BKM21_02950 [Pseudomonas syringae pv. syringae]
MAIETKSSEDYLDYEIRVKVFGPVKTNPRDDRCQMAHYLGAVAVFQGDAEIPGTLDHLQGQYADMYLAENAALARGRELVNRIVALP